MPDAQGMPTQEDVTKILTGFASMMPIFQSLIDATKGYKARCEAAGFPTVVCDQMALQFHSFLIHNLMNAPTVKAKPADE